MPSACRKLLLGIPWISSLLIGGCQLLTGASERRLVSSEEGCDAGQCTACRPGDSRCEGSVRKTCDLTGNYRDDLCPRAQPFCTGDGDCVACIEPPDDRNSCTQDDCIEGMPFHTPHLDGTPCPAGGQCTFGSCMGPCNNGRLDGRETGVDCGGDCLPCDDNMPCKRAEDCESRLCSYCTDLATCTVCSSDCSAATCGIPPIVIHSPTCFAVLVMRNGQVVESQSSEGLCQSDDRRVRPRPGDVTYLYVKDPPVNLAAVSGTSDEYTAKDWSGRCVVAFTTRSELLQEIERTAAWTPRTTPPARSALVGMTCEAAALFKW